MRKIESLDVQEFLRERMEEVLRLWIIGLEEDIYNADYSLEGLAKRVDDIAIANHLKKHMDDYKFDIFVSEKKEDEQ